MSEENVEIVRTALDDYNRGDLESLARSYSRDFVWDMSRSVGHQRGVFRLDEMLQWSKDLFETFESHRLEAEEFIEAGDLVIVPSTAYLRGRDGIEVTARSTSIYEIRDSAIVRITLYQERQEALEAAGLSE